MVFGITVFWDKMHSITVFVSWQWKEIAKIICQYFGIWLNFWIFLTMWRYKTLQISFLLLRVLRYLTEFWPRVMVSETPADRLSITWFYHSWNLLFISFHRFTIHNHYLSSCDASILNLFISEFSFKNNDYDLDYCLSTVHSNKRKK